MKYLPKPTDSHRDIFDSCISNIRDLVLKSNLENARQVILNAGNTYETLKAGQQLYTYAPSNSINGTITKAQMIKLYSDKLGKLNQPARRYYDKLRLIAPNGKCPLCGVHDVKTLDHYLPKAKHPIFALFPINLIPACTDCNTGKKPHVPRNYSEETLHPYFDDIDGERWLYSEISKTKPAKFTYYVNPPSNWSSELTNRVETHLYVYSLYSLYSYHAAEELSNINAQLKILQSAGAGAVKSHLKAGYESRLEANRNSWQTAMYEAMYNDSWFQDNCYF